MNRIQRKFAEKQQGILNIYYTAGFPTSDSTVAIAQALDDAGVDIIELGMPYSDPLADGTTIQNSSSIALKGGMNIDLLFEQVRAIRRNNEVPIVLMGYLNQLMKFGELRFLDACVEAGVDGLIIPDLPLEIFEQKFKAEFQSRNLSMSFLITPQTSDDRIKKSDELSSGFIYVVADNSITGATTGNLSDKQKAYFEHIKSLKLSNPTLIGFGITNHSQFETASSYANGAIVGSEFIRQLEKSADSASIKEFVESLRGESVA